MAHRDPPRPRRGAATRGAILAAARARFAADGYERATIRAIAAEAGVDPALVVRHYGNKAGLFAAAAAAELDLRLPDLRAGPREAVGATLVEHFLCRWEQDEALKVLLRTAATHDTAAEHLRALFAAQVAPAIAALCHDPRSAPVRAGLISSQILGFALCRYILRLPPVVAMSHADIVHWLGPTVQRYACG
ncbi:TetR family transcriptional regulator [Candidatus Methylocalor cossyra]|uniref:Helix-turn-helix transcriptional regulator n=1 Tax=Candidatus Methylocalor cossyra TaxID=3108543 RepID=A0ABM9NII0_9GAMM